MRNIAASASSYALTSTILLKFYGTADSAIAMPSREVLKSKVPGLLSAGRVEKHSYVILT